MNLDRRSLLIASFTAASGLALSPRAACATLIPLDLEALVNGSGVVIVGRAVESEAAWEHFAGSRRIVTRTRVVHDELWHSSQESSSTMESVVVTLGGVVGKVGQKVPGEAALRKEESSVLFLSPGGRLGRAVVGMAQGHYRLTSNSKDARLIAPTDLHLHGARSARFGVGLLGGATLSRARQLVEDAAR